MTPSMHILNRGPHGRWVTIANLIQNVVQVLGSQVAHFAETYLFYCHAYHT